MRIQYKHNKLQGGIFYIVFLNNICELDFVKVIQQNETNF